MRCRSGRRAQRAELARAAESPERGRRVHREDAGCVEQLVEPRSPLAAMQIHSCTQSPTVTSATSAALGCQDRRSASVEHGVSGRGWQRRPSRADSWAKPSGSRTAAMPPPVGGAKGAQQPAQAGADRVGADQQVQPDLRSAPSSTLMTAPHVPACHRSSGRSPPIAVAQSVLRRWPASVAATSGRGGRRASRSPRPARGAATRRCCGSAVWNRPASASSRSRGHRRGPAGLGRARREPPRSSSERRAGAGRCAVQSAGGTPWRRAVLRPHVLAVGWRRARGRRSRAITWRTTPAGTPGDTAGAGSGAPGGTGDAAAARRRRWWAGPRR